MLTRLQIVLRDVTRCLKNEIVLLLRHFLYLVNSFLNKVDLFLQLFGNRLDLRSVLNVSEFEAKHLLLGLVYLTFRVRTLLLLLLINLFVAEQGLFLWVLLAMVGVNRIVIHLTVGLLALRLLHSSINGIFLSSFHLLIQHLLLFFLGLPLLLHLQELLRLANPDLFVLLIHLVNITLQLGRNVDAEHEHFVAMRDIHVARWIGVHVRIQVVIGSTLQPVKS